MIELSVRRGLSLGIKEQVKQQIRAAIASGHLCRGERLPSSRDLAGVLGINRNTVAQAYAELTSEGYLVSAVGSGTVVAQTSSSRDTAALARIVRSAMAEAELLGLSEEDLLDQVVAEMALRSACLKRKQVFVVDCNTETVEHIRSRIESEIGAKTAGTLIQEIEASPEKALAAIGESDLVVCGLSHMNDLRATLPECRVDLLGVMLRPDIRVANEIARVAPGSVVGYCCSNQRSADTLYRSSLFDQGVELRRMVMGLDGLEKDASPLASCSVVFVTNLTAHRLASLIRPDQRVIEVDIDLEAGSIDVIRDRLLSQSPLQ